RAEVAGRGDPVDGGGLVQLLGHVELRALENPLCDSEGDAVDEVTLPELEGRGRCLLQAWEIGEVPAKRLPALRLLLGVRRAAPPQAHMAEGEGKHARA